MGRGRRGGCWIFFVFPTPPFSPSPTQICKSHHCLISSFYAFRSSKIKRISLPTFSLCFYILLLTTNEPSTIPSFSFYTRLAPSRSVTLVPDDEFCLPLNFHFLVRYQGHRSLLFPTALSLKRVRFRIIRTKEIGVELEV